MGAERVVESLYERLRARGFRYNVEEWHAEAGQRIREAPKTHQRHPAQCGGDGRPDPVELATARLTWQTAVTDARVIASGSRADLAALLLSCASTSRRVTGGFAPVPVICPPLGYHHGAARRTADHGGDHRG